LQVQDVAEPRCRITLVKPTILQQALLKRVRYCENSLFVTLFHGLLPTCDSVRICASLIVARFSPVHRRRPVHLLPCLPLFSFTWPFFPLFLWHYECWVLTPRNLSPISRTRVFLVKGKREPVPRDPTYLI